MRLPGPSLLTTDRGRGRRGSRGFTLVEFGLALLVGLSGLWLGLLLVRQAAHRERTAQFVVDLREFSAALENHRRQKGAWPASTTGDIPVPAGLEDALGETNWAAGSPFGGSYGWVEPARGREDRGAIVLTAFAPAFPLALTRADLIGIDQRIDDGNLTTGRFRTGFNGWPVYLVGDKP